ncbi:hypothetical protein HYH03_015703 [Edaphochlamys debaryana]|uniref:SRCR domain-containing protein n=1 Tax=Edaphochlamys debaryana TaxID=47281 RepID=A0A836BSA5_9CHLO|nr:hypothetical protein HYH03_015703 [Edaphochlamys debaryana]|eukprot:KAG2485533.1 hypothetical protein HYH03_015703 [Edaphochlamys debaryana]
MAGHRTRAGALPLVLVALVLAISPVALAKTLRKRVPPSPPATTGSTKTLSGSDFVLTVLSASKVTGRGKLQKATWQPLRATGASGEVQGYVWANLTQAKAQVPVCKSKFSTAAAVVACRAAGFATGRLAAASVTKGRKAIAVRNSTFLTDLSCKGTAATAACSAAVQHAPSAAASGQCKSVVAVLCSGTIAGPSTLRFAVYLQDIAVSMLPYPYNFDTGLFGPAIKTFGVTGYVQVAVRSISGTGVPALVPVCSDGFDKVDAEVACRMAGLYGGEVMPGANGQLVVRSWPAATPLLSKMTCVGSGAYGGCRAIWVPASNCSSVGLAAVRCAASATGSVKSPPPPSPKPTHPPPLDFELLPPPPPPPPPSKD